ncbi:histidine kinase, partial [Streptomyces sp. NPDC127574]
LSLVRRLAERQGGSAEVADAEGGGAEFTVVLPEALAEAPAETLGDVAANVDPARAAVESAGEVRETGYAEEESR